MMRKFLPVLLLAAIVIGVVTCKKFVEPETYTTANIPKVEIVEVTNVTDTSAKFTCQVTKDGGVTIIDRGLCWSAEPDPTVDGLHVSGGYGMGAYTCDIFDLEYATDYYVRAYAVNTFGTAYSETYKLTSAPIMPAVTTTLQLTTHTHPTELVPESSFRH